MEDLFNHLKPNKMEEIMKLEYELTIKYLKNRNQENWDKLIEIRKIGEALEEQIEKQKSHVKN